ncbi:hypothetical protein CSAL01_10291 [Colletotrichum salicis]|uniref:Uncharacterized protein n=1 Tax=Colletotrichum salicis TaxID=1209931 RepID=A0A135UGS3_9PEZI|nr:hypothetical protein CSAL01_10291 [Colletotrichum salicis]
MSEIQKIAAGLSPDHDMVLITNDGLHIQNSIAKVLDVFLSQYKIQCPGNGNTRPLITCQKHVAATPMLVNPFSRLPKTAVPAVEKNVALAQEKPRSLEQSQTVTKPVIFVTVTPMEGGHKLVEGEIVSQGTAGKADTGGGHIVVANPSHANEQGRGSCVDSSQINKIHGDDNYTHGRGGRGGSPGNRGARGGLSREHGGRGGCGNSSPTTRSGLSPMTRGGLSQESHGTMRGRGGHGGSPPDRGGRGYSRRSSLRHDSGGDDGLNY